MRRAAVAWAAAIVISGVLLALPLVALAATSAVTIQNSAFAPPTLTVRVGDVVTWTNRDAFSHTSTSDTGAWDTSVITAGASHSVTFTSAGTFAYHCAIHAFMHGTIVVQAVNTPTPQPTPPPTAPPTPVRTAPPTVTQPPTLAPTDEPTAAPTTAAPTATPSATTAATETPAVAPSPSAVAVQLTPAPVPGAPVPLVIGAAVLAVVALGAIAFFLARRS